MHVDGWRNNLLVIHGEVWFELGTQSGKPRGKLTRADELPLSHFLMSWEWIRVRTKGFGWEPWLVLRLAVRRLSGTRESSVVEKTEAFSCDACIPLRANSSAKTYTADNLYPRNRTKSRDCVAWLPWLLLRSKFKYLGWTWDWMRRYQCGAYTSNMIYVIGRWVGQHEAVDNLNEPRCRNCRGLRKFSPRDWDSLMEISDTEPLRATAVTAAGSDGPESVP